MPLGEAAPRRYHGGLRTSRPFAMQTPTPDIRPLAPYDLEAVLRVQAACYPPAMQEPAAVVAARIRGAGDTGFVATAGGVVLAYAFAYRSTLGAVTPLGADFGIAAAPDTLYLHDLAVAPSAAGAGLARRLAAQVAALAQSERLPWCALVSVQDSRRFWERLGYAASACKDGEARRALASYPGRALYMTRCIWHQALGPPG